MARSTLFDQHPAGPAPPGPAEWDDPAPRPQMTAGRSASAWAGGWWRRRYWFAAAAVVAAVLLAATSLAVSLHALSKPTLSAGAVNATVNSKVGSAVNSLQSQPPAGVVVYNQVAPAVVVIQANIPGARSEESIGAGVIVTNTGEILTALHVVTGRHVHQGLFLRRHHVHGDHPVVRRQPRHRVADAPAFARRRRTRRARRRRSDRRRGVCYRSPAGPGRLPSRPAWSPASTAPSRAPTAGPWPG